MAGWSICEHQDDELCAPLSIKPLDGNLSREMASMPTDICWLEGSSLPIARTEDLTGLGAQAALQPDTLPVLAEAQGLLQESLCRQSSHQQQHPSCSCFGHDGGSSTSHSGGYATQPNSASSQCGSTYSSMLAAAAKFGAAGAHPTILGNAALTAEGPPQRSIQQQASTAAVCLASSSLPGSLSSLHSTSAAGSSTAGPSDFPAAAAAGPQAAAASAAATAIATSRPTGPKRLVLPDALLHQDISLVVTSSLFGGSRGNSPQPLPLPRATYRQQQQQQQRQQLEQQVQQDQQVSTVDTSSFSSNTSSANAANTTACRKGANAVSSRRGSSKHHASSSKVHGTPSLGSASIVAAPAQASSTRMPDSLENTSATEHSAGSHIGSSCSSASSSACSSPCSRSKHQQSAWNSSTKVVKATNTSSNGLSAGRTTAAWDEGGLARPSACANPKGSECTSVTCKAAAPSCVVCRSGSGMSIDASAGAQQTGQCASAAAVQQSAASNTATAAAAEQQQHTSSNSAVDSLTGTRQHPARPKPLVVDADADFLLMPPDLVLDKLSPLCDQSGCSLAASTAASRTGSRASSRTVSANPSRDTSSSGYAAAAWFADSSSSGSHAAAGSSTDWRVACKSHRPVVIADRAVAHLSPWHSSDAINQPTAESQQQYVEAPAAAAAAEDPRLQALNANRFDRFRPLTQQLMPLTVSDVPAAASKDLPAAVSAKFTKWPSAAACSTDADCAEDTTQTVEGTAAVSDSADVAVEQATTAAGLAGATTNSSHSSSLGTAAASDAEGDVLAEQKPAGSVSVAGGIVDPTGGRMQPIYGAAAVQHIDSMPGAYQQCEQPKQAQQHKPQQHKPQQLFQPGQHLPAANQSHKLNCQPQQLQQQHGTAAPRAAVAKEAAEPATSASFADVAAVDCPHDLDTLPFAAVQSRIISQSSSPWSFSDSQQHLSEQQHSVPSEQHLSPQFMLSMSLSVSCSPPKHSSCLSMSGAGAATARYPVTVGYATTLLPAAKHNRPAAKAAMLLSNSTNDVAGSMAKSSSSASTISGVSCSGGSGNGHANNQEAPATIKPPQQQQHAPGIISMDQAATASVDEQTSSKGVAGTDSDRVCGGSSSTTGFSGHKRLQQLIPQRPPPRQQQLPARIIAWSGGGSPAAAAAGPPMPLLPECAAFEAPMQSVLAAVEAAAQPLLARAAARTLPAALADAVIVGDTVFGSIPVSQPIAISSSRVGQLGGGGGSRSAGAAKTAADSGITSSFKAALLESMCRPEDLCHLGEAEQQHGQHQEQQQQPSIPQQDERGARPNRRLPAQLAWQLQQQQHEDEQQQLQRQQEGHQEQEPLVSNVVAFTFPCTSAAPAFGARGGSAPSMSLKQQRQRQQQPVAAASVYGCNRRSVRPSWSCGNNLLSDTVADVDDFIGAKPVMRLSRSSENLQQYQEADDDPAGTLQSSSRSCSLGLCADEQQQQQQQAAGKVEASYEQQQWQQQKSTPDAVVQLTPGQTVGTTQQQQQQQAAWQDLQHQHQHKQQQLSKLDPAIPAVPQQQQQRTTSSSNNGPIRTTSLPSPAKRQGLLSAQIKRNAINGAADSPALSNMAAAATATAAAAAGVNKQPKDDAPVLESRVRGRSVAATVLGLAARSQQQHSVLIAERCEQFCRQGSSGAAASHGQDPQQQQQQPPVRRSRVSWADAPAQTDTGEISSVTVAAATGDGAAGSAFVSCTQNATTDSSKHEWLTSSPKAPSSSKVHISSLHGLQRASSVFTFAGATSCAAAAAGLPPTCPSKGLKRKTGMMRAVKSCHEFRTLCNDDTDSVTAAAISSSSQSKQRPPSASETINSEGSSSSDGLIAGHCQEQQEQQQVNVIWEAFANADGRRPPPAVCAPAAIAAAVTAAATMAPAPGKHAVAVNNGGEKDAADAGHQPVAFAGQEGAPSALAAAAAAADGVGDVGSSAAAVAACESSRGEPSLGRQCSQSAPECSSLLSCSWHEIQPLLDNGSAAGAIPSGLRHSSSNSGYHGVAAAAAPAWSSACGAEGVANGILCLYSFEGDYYGSSRASTARDCSNSGGGWREQQKQQQSAAPPVTIGCGVSPAQQHQQVQQQQIQGLLTGGLQHQPAGQANQACTAFVARAVHDASETLKLSPVGGSGFFDCSWWQHKQQQQHCVQGNTTAAAGAHSNGHSYATGTGAAARVAAGAQAHCNNTIRRGAVPAAEAAKACPNAAILPVSSGSLMFRDFDLRGLMLLGQVAPQQSGSTLAKAVKCFADLQYPVQ